jgi:hypothetical protein
MRLKYIPTSHYWGQWSDSLFIDVECAAGDIGKFCRRWGRFFVNTKEKYGTARAYTHFSYGLDLWSLWTGGYCFYHGPKWFWGINCFIQNHTDWLTPAIQSYQVFIYKLAVRRALRRYPHIHNEILSGIDHQDLFANPVTDFDEIEVSDD